MDGEDAGLLAAVAEGSERAFNRFIDRHQEAVRTFARGLVRDEEDGDDIAQETFLAVWRRPTAFRGGTSARSWLLAIAWRKAKEGHRAWFRRRRREDAHLEIGGPTGQLPALESAIALRQALGALPLAQRAAVMLCLAAEMSHGEAAEVLGLPLGTVKSYVLRGRARLAGLLEGPDDDRKG